MAVKESKIYSCPLKTGLIRCPETSVRNYDYSMRNKPEERTSLFEVIILFRTLLKM